MGVYTTHDCDAKQSQTCSCTQQRMMVGVDENKYAYLKSMLDEVKLYFLFLGVASLHFRVSLLSNLAFV